MVQVTSHISNHTYSAVLHTAQTHHPIGPLVRSAHIVGKMSHESHDLETRKDIGEAFGRIRDLEKSSNQLERENDRVTQDLVEVAKQSVFTARESQAHNSHYRLICFLNGDLKDKVKKDFTDTSEKSKAWRDVKTESTEMDQERPQKFKSKFLETVGQWAADQIGDGGPAQGLRESLQHHVTMLAALPAELAIQKVQLKPRDPPAQGKAWPVEVTVKGTPEGATLFGLLETHLKALYSVKMEETRRPKAADFACRADGNGKDKSQTVTVCRIAGLEPREGKGNGREVKGQGQGKEKAKTAAKRPSPSREEIRNSRPRGSEGGGEASRDRR